MAVEFTDFISETIDILLAVAAVGVLFLIGEQLGSILLKCVERKHRR